MPSLNWIGKDAVVKHHKDVPFRLLEPVPELSGGTCQFVMIKEKQWSGVDVWLTQKAMADLLACTRSIISAAPAIEHLDRGVALAIRLRDVAARHIAAAINHGTLVSALLAQNPTPWVSFLPIVAKSE